MRVSVIIATLNRAESLNRCLGSLSRQRQRPYELVIVDNGSSDNTREIAASYSKSLPIVYILEREQDVSTARNAGIKAATGDIIAFTDDDCTAEEDWIENIAARHESADSKIVGGMTLNGYPESLICRLWERIYVLWFNCVNVLTDGTRNGYYEFPKGPCLVKTLLTNNISYRREIFDLAGGFKPNTSMNEDAELHYRLRSSGHAILYSPGLKVRHYYRKDAGSMAKALYTSGKGLFLIKKGKHVYNSLLELDFPGKRRFVLYLLYYPIHLLRRRKIKEALLILPFFMLKEIIILGGFWAARLKAVFRNKELADNA